MMYQLCPHCLRALTTTGYIDAPFPYECKPCGKYFVAVYGYRNESGENDLAGGWVPVFFEATATGWSEPLCRR